MVREHHVQFKFFSKICGKGSADLCKLNWGLNSHVFCGHVKFMLFFYCSLNALRHRAQRLHKVPRLAVVEVLNNLLVQRNGHKNGGSQEKQGYWNRMNGET